MTLDLLLLIFWFTVAAFFIVAFTIVTVALIRLGKPRYMYLRAGLIGAAYGLLLAALHGEHRAMQVSISHSYEYLDQSKISLAYYNALVTPHFAGEIHRLSVILALAQDGPDFAVKGIILIILLTWLLKDSGIPWTGKRASKRARATS